MGRWTTATAAGISIPTTEAVRPTAPLHINQLIISVAKTTPTSSNKGANRSCIMDIPNSQVEKISLGFHLHHHVILHRLHHRRRPMQILSQGTTINKSYSLLNHKDIIFELITKHKAMHINNNISADQTGSNKLSNQDLALVQM
jgi:hypothetical protein